MSSEELCLQIGEAVIELTQSEADTLTFLAANPEFTGPNYAIECSGAWTNYEGKRFEADDLRECLDLALDEYREYEAISRHEISEAIGNSCE